MCLCIKENSDIPIFLNQPMNKTTFLAILKILISVVYRGGQYSIFVTSSDMQNFLGLINFFFKFAKSLHARAYMPLTYSQ